MFGKFSAKDVQDMLSNPIYGYGINLIAERIPPTGKGIPQEVVVRHVQRLHRELAQERQERGHAFTLEELDGRFRALFEWLEREGICNRGPDALPIVGKEAWLQAQRAMIERMAAGKEP